MAVTLISLKDFILEISSSIINASARLAQENMSHLKKFDDRDILLGSTTLVHTLEITKLKVNFSARVVNRKSQNDNHDKTSEIMLDFHTYHGKCGTNMQGEILFSGKGEPIGLEDGTYTEDDREGEVFEML